MVSSKFFLIEESTYLKLWLGLRSGNKNILFLAVNLAKILHLPIKWETVTTPALQVNSDKVSKLGQSFYIMTGFLDWDKFF